MNFSTNDTMTFKRVIEDIIDARIKKKGITSYISAVVSSINSDLTVNVYLPPDRNNIANGLINKSGETLAVGNSVEICTKNGSLANAWIAIKHGKGYPGDNLNRYVAMGRLSSLSLNATTNTVATFNSITIKDSNYVSSSSNRIVIKVAGTYRISYSVRWADVTSNNNCNAGVSINSSTTDNELQSTWATNTQRLTTSSFKIRDLAVGDTISGLFYSNAATIVSTGIYWVEKIG